MRHVIVALLFFTTICHAEDEPDKKFKRYGYDYAPKLYPQSTPTEALNSIIKALNQEKLEYMMAQLVDPKFVDTEVQQIKTLIPRKGNPAAIEFLAFEQLVKQTKRHFLEDPQLVKELRTFAKEGKFEPKENIAVATAKSIPARRVYMTQQNGRWFLMNKQK